MIDGLRVWNRVVPPIWILPRPCNSGGNMIFYEGKPIELMYFVLVKPSLWADLQMQNG